jgi:hypothetical protein
VKYFVVESQQVVLTSSQYKAILEVGWSAVKGTRDMSVRVDWRHVA